MHMVVHKIINLKIRGIPKIWVGLTAFELFDQHLIDSLDSPEILVNFGWPMEVANKDRFYGHIARLITVTQIHKNLVKFL